LILKIIKAIAPLDKDKIIVIVEDQGQEKKKFIPLDSNLKNLTIITLTTTAGD
jgi:hypothetical protein